MKSILDPDFRYTSSDATDLRKTFARIRMQQRMEARDAPAPGAPRVDARAEAARVPQAGASHRP